MEYNVVDSDVWNTHYDNQTNVLPGTYLMRIKSEYTNDYESKTTEVTVPAIYHDVNTSTYGNGRIESTTTAVEGKDLLFKVIIDTGHGVDWVKVNGEVVTSKAEGKYIVSILIANTTIEALFKLSIINVDVVGTFKYSE